MAKEMTATTATTTAPETSPTEVTKADPVLTAEGTKLATARAIAAEYQERALAAGVSVEHPETARLAKAAGVILGLADALEAAYTKLGTPLSV